MLSQLLVDERNEGKIEGETESAPSMIAQGFDLATIAKGTEISLEKLEGLRRSLTARIA